MVKLCFTHTLDDTSFRPVSAKSPQGTSPTKETKAISFAMLEVTVQGVQGDSLASNLRWEESGFHHLLRSLGVLLLLLSIQRSCPIKLQFAETRSFRRHSCGPSVSQCFQAVQLAICASFCDSLTRAFTWVKPNNLPRKNDMAIHGTANGEIYGNGRKKTHSKCVASIPCMSAFLLNNHSDSPDGSTLWG